ncbi:MAG TPA: NAD-glutamate dehydrogenase [Bauldia sp.]|nr:NAD-glutamate dehydrogenase [Bauldia sp.]
MAHAKLAASADLLAGRVADDATLDDELVRYFPARMRKAHAGDIEAHRLRAEIIATMIANAMVNRGGPTYLVRVGERTGAGPVAIARAYVAVRDSFGLRDLDGAIDALDNQVDGTLQLDLYRAVQDLLLDRTVWFLRNVDLGAGVGPVVAAVGGTVAAFARRLERLLPTDEAARIAAAASSLESAGVPAGLAGRIARLPALAAAADLHLVAAATGHPLDEAAAAFFGLGETFRLSRIEALAARLPATDYYDGLARDRALEALSRIHRAAATEALAAGGVAPWLEARRGTVARIRGVIEPLVESGEFTLSRLAVAVGLLADLVRA